MRGGGEGRRGYVSVPAATGLGRFGNAVPCVSPAPTPGVFMVRHTAVAHSSWVFSLLLVASSTSARRRRDLQTAGSAW